MHRVVAVTAIDPDDLISDGAEDGAAAAGVVRGTAPTPLEGAPELLGHLHRVLVPGQQDQRVAPPRVNEHRYSCEPNG